VLAGTPSSPRLSRRREAPARCIQKMLTRPSSRGDQHFAPAAGLGAGRSYHPLLFHTLEQLRGLVVADAEVALDVADRAIAGLSHERDVAIIQWVIRRGRGEALLVFL